MIRKGIKSDVYKYNVKVSSMLPKISFLPIGYKKKYGGVENLTFTEISCASRNYLKFFRAMHFWWRISETDTQPCASGIVDDLHTPHAKGWKSVQSRLSFWLRCKGQGGPDRFPVIPRTSVFEIGENFQSFRVRPPMCSKNSTEDLLGEPSR